MALKELIQKIREKIDGDKQKIEENNTLPDWETRDRHLKSLRRLRRTQLDEMEKQQLLKQIKEHDRQRTIKYIWGTKTPTSNSRRILRKIKQKQTTHNIFLR